MACLQLIVVDQEGKELDRLSPWANYVVRPEKSIIFEQKLWNPQEVCSYCILW